MLRALSWIWWLQSKGSGRTNIISREIIPLLSSDYLNLIHTNQQLQNNGGKLYDSHKRSHITFNVNPRIEMPISPEVNNMFSESIILVHSVANQLQDCRKKQQKIFQTIPKKPIPTSGLRESSSKSNQRSVGQVLLQDQLTSNILTYPMQQTTIKWAQSRPNELQSKVFSWQILHKKQSDQSTAKTTN